MAEMTASVRTHLVANGHRTVRTWAHAQGDSLHHCLQRFSQIRSDDTPRTILATFRPVISCAALFPVLGGALGCILWQCFLGLLILEERDEVHEFCERQL